MIYDSSIATRTQAPNYSPEWGDYYPEWGDYYPEWGPGGATTPSTTLSEKGSLMSETLLYKMDFQNIP